MSRRTEVFWLLLAAATLATAAHAAPNPAIAGIGRAATLAEVKAWDIDVRADFKGLPKGAGSVALGDKVWEAKCASCHGAFGESNEVFTPLVGGTTKQDIETGRVANLAHNGFPQRTTLMKVSKVSTLWDYINRAMPWNAPKSLSTDEVYGVLAYLLNLGEIVPADFVLTDRNIAQVQDRLPNRNGKVVQLDMWCTQGHGDVKNPLCMKDCPTQGAVVASLPDAARNTHGNIADQLRPFGAVRGTDTAMALAVGMAPAAAVRAAPDDVSALLKANACTACHRMTNKIVGPAFQDVARKYAANADVVDYLAAKIRKGGQGVWGAIPMPEQAQLGEADTRAIARWIATGAR
jgi:cytochrome c